jgi:hypothetical protein
MMKNNSHRIAVAFLALGLLFAAKPLSAGDKAQGQPKPQSSAIQIAMIQSDEIKLPMEFQLALYENVVRQIEQSKKFQHVYRDGDTNAASAPDLVTLHSNVYGFKQGSEEKRQVTTVTGATQIKVHCQVTDKDGKTVLSQDVTGNVRFIGGNLRATLDFAKKVTQLLVTSFQ